MTEDHFAHVSAQRARLSGWRRQSLPEQQQHLVVKRRAAVRPSSPRDLALRHSAEPRGSQFAHLHNGGIKSANIAGLWYVWDAHGMRQECSLVLDPWRFAQGTFAVIVNVIFIFFFAETAIHCFSALFPFSLPNRSLSLSVMWFVCSGVARDNHILHLCQHGYGFKKGVAT